MAYIVIEKHGGWKYAIIVPNINTGDNLIITKEKEAIKTVKECQDGVILNLDNLPKADEAIELLGKLVTLLKSGVFEFSNNATDKDKEYFHKLKKKLKDYDN